MDVNKQFKASNKLTTLKVIIIPVSSFPVTGLVHKLLDKESRSVSPPTTNEIIKIIMQFGSCVKVSNSFAKHTMAQIILKLPIM